MLKNITLFFLAAGILSSVACSSSEDKLRAVVVDDTAYLIPATIKSCKAKAEGTPSDDITSDYFQYSQVYLNWNEAFDVNTSTDMNVFYFSLIQMRVESPYIVGNSYSMAIAGDELAALAPAYSKNGCAFVDSNNPTLQEEMACATLNNSWWKAGKGTLFPGQVLKISCPLTFGGIQGSQLFSTTGPIKMIGYSMNSKGEKVPVQGQTFVNVEKIIDN